MSADIRYPSPVADVQVHIDDAGGRPALLIRKHAVTVHKADDERDHVDGKHHNIHEDGHGDLLP
eukprot:scaffold8094_cov376-Prasinococcus_capsulatus_cf.AAC.3